MKVLFLSQYFMPEQGATSELLSGIARKLAEDKSKHVAGLAGQPSYFGAAKFDHKMSLNGVEVTRTWSTQLEKNTAYGRVLNSATFSLSALFGLLFHYRDNLVVAVTNPPTLMWMCYLANKISGLRYVILIHDVYPDIAVELGALSRSNLISYLWRRLNRLAYRRAEHIVVLGRDMKDVIKRELDPERSDADVTIIPNWADKDAVHPLLRKGHPIIRSLEAENRFVVLYSGNIGRFHEIETVLDAARRLDDGSFLFLFYGEGKQSDLVRRAAEESLYRSVRLLPFQPREQLGLTLTGCDVSLVTLRAGLSGLAVPSKLYGALASGKPIIAIVPKDSEAARVVQDNNCGKVTAPGDGEELAEVLKSLRGDGAACRRFGSRARRAFEDHYDIDIVAKEWAHILEQIWAHSLRSGRASAG